MAKIKNPDLLIDELRARYAYDPATGVVTSKRTGRPISANNGRGYLRAALGNGRILMRLHRLAWALHTGVWPDGPIDHRNKIRDDNRIDNLRVALPSENSRNRAATSRAGYLGVRIAPNGKFYGDLRALDGRTIRTPRRDSAFDAAVDVAVLGVFHHGRSIFTYDDAVTSAACELTGFDRELLELFDFDHALWTWRKP